MESRKTKPERRFTCPVGECERKFRWKAELKRHMLIHLDEKPLQCEICERRFTLEQHLKEHLARHVGNSLYVCRVNGCDREFYQSSMLSIHRKTHKGYKSRKCDFRANPPRDFNKPSNNKLSGLTQEGINEFLEHYSHKRFKIIEEDPVDEDQSDIHSFVSLNRPPSPGFKMINGGKSKLNLEVDKSSAEGTRPIEGILGVPTKIEMVNKENNGNYPQFEVVAPTFNFHSKSTIPVNGNVINIEKVENAEKVEHHESTLGQENSPGKIILPQIPRSFIGDVGSEHNTILNNPRILTSYPNTPIYYIPQNIPPQMTYKNTQMNYYSHGNQMYNYAHIYGAAWNNYYPHFPHYYPQNIDVPQIKCE